jgi:hypothetical protein
MIAVVAAESADALVTALIEAGEIAMIAGHLVARTHEAVEFDGTLEL